MDKQNKIKNRIIESARPLFTKYGYSNVTMDGISREIGISKRTIYEYFKSKEELLDEIIDRLLSDAKLKVDKIISKFYDRSQVDYFEQLKHLWDLMVEYVQIFTKEFQIDIKKTLPHIWKKINDFKENQFKTNFSIVYKYARENNYFKPDVDENILHLVHYNSIISVLQPEVLAELPFTTKEVIRKVYDIILTGIYTEESRLEYYKRQHNEN